MRLGPEATEALRRVYEDLHPCDGEMRASCSAARAIPELVSELGLLGRALDIARAEIRELQARLDASKNR